MNDMIDRAAEEVAKTMRSLSDKMRRETAPHGGIGMDSHELTSISPDQLEHWADLLTRARGDREVCPDCSGKGTVAMPGTEGVVYPCESCRPSKGIASRPAGEASHGN